eukprot:gnl/Dysnectes_brevis/5065_a7124_620.p1 GENE.gnl/Dysnectes_brevis/5065_a7124_620~~gnl/Dysnectes_brevis/5065_a7124_620.p1  ORF type:complete len:200 (+),score=6.16 gnl/Dysnectes_brevis/5065_a7124_620:90-689(+)
MSELSEKQKMINGGRFNALDPVLVHDRAAVKKLCSVFNHLANSSMETKENREDILRQILPNSPNPFIEPTFFVDFGYNIITGTNFYCNHGCVMLDAAPITIGDDVMFAPGVMISTVTHPLDHEDRLIIHSKALATEISAPVRIGDRCWLGMGAKIMPGVTIGDRVVVGAGAVVTRDVESDCVVAGVPARVIRRLESPVN